MAGLLRHDLPVELLARVEDAGLTASAAPQQRWLDGWLLRLSPGKAKRSRCINALAPGRRPLLERLADAQALYRAAGLPAIFRVTPFTVPSGLDGELEREGWRRFDDTRVMVCPVLPRPLALPAGDELLALPLTDFAELVGTWRGSAPAQRAAHAERLTQAGALRSHAFVLQRQGEPMAAGQFVVDGDLVGLYDVHTTEAARNRGCARTLCAQLLAQAAALGARVGYLQVDNVNAAARAVYARLGFSDAYAYGYRTDDPEAH